MKSIYVVLALAAFWHASEVVIGGPAGGPRTLFADIAEEFEQLAQPVLDGIAGAQAVSLTASSTLAEDIQTAVDEIVKKAQELAESVGDGVVSAVDLQVLKFTSTVQAFRVRLAIAIDSATNSVKRQVYRDIQKQLERLESSSTALKKSVADLKDKWSNDIQAEQKSIVREWNVWAAQLLQQVAIETRGNENAKTRSEKIINEVINRYSQYLNSCADELDVNLQDYEKRIQSTIETHQDTLSSLITEVQSCLDSEDESIPASHCRSAVRRILTKLSAANADLVKLKLESVKLARSAFSNSICVIETRAEYRIEKRQVEKQIQEIIKNPNKTDSNSSDDSSSGDSSSSGSSSDDSSSSGSSSGDSSSSDSSSSGSSSDDSSSGDSSSSDSSSSGSSSDDSSSGDSSSSDSSSSGSSSDDSSSGDSSSSDSSSGESSESSDDSSKSSDDSSKSSEDSSETSDDSSKSSDSNDQTKSEEASSSGSSSDSNEVADAGK